MKMLQKCLVVLILTFLVTGCASRYVEIYTDSGKTSYLDIKSVRWIQQGRVAEFGEKHEYSGAARREHINTIKKYWAGVRNPDDFDHILYRYALDVPNRRTKLVSIAHYDKQGNVMGYADFDDKWDYIIPGSIGETKYKEVVKLLK